MSSLLRPPDDWITTEERDHRHSSSRCVTSDRVKKQRHEEQNLVNVLMTLTLLLAPCALVLGGNVDDAVGVDVEGNLDLRNTSGSGGDSYQGELTQDLVVCCHLSLSLTHLDLHLSLPISCCGEDLEGSR